ncbi:hypothetical protein IWW57_000090 [Coemansia sp. S610]|uniref:Uncharacterized protein n=1 Tax=Coemansia spiralis TaxID=417178 RepID=A0A9W8GP37_9FUNG|nr:hypothetical protein IWW57_000090 [Coemansia sp. S610]KAJ2688758.1 hypothetical protein IWW39_001973 [Coemansia spiralis]KAJ2697366.1 hypothetical protein H4218_004005 [Coemansia sp. IMI 209128]
MAEQLFLHVCAHIGDVGSETCLIPFDEKMPARSIKQLKKYVAKQIEGTIYMAEVNIIHHSKKTVFEESPFALDDPLSELDTADGLWNLVICDDAYLRLIAATPKDWEK